MLEAALTWAQLRGYPYDSLPKGDRDSADSCPLARATGYLVAGGQAAPPGNLGLVWQALPPRVATFTELFDKGHYPELVRK